MMPAGTGRMIRAIAIVFLGLSAGTGSVFAAAGGEGLRHASANVHDLASVQRGAKLFMNYCHSCHSAQYMRYQRLSEDLNIPEAEVQELLIFGDREVTDTMDVAMDSGDAEDWFGVAPPDLTLTARSRGPDWVFSFLNGFYMTDQGWNNTVLEGASMPHVLWELQGIQRPVTETYTDDDGEEHTRMVGLELDREGSMSVSEYERATRDLTAFMIYLAEPAVLKREQIGVWVLLFLALLTFVCYLLYKEYWKDVRK